MGHRWAPMITPPCRHPSAQWCIWSPCLRTLLASAFHRVNLMYWKPRVVMIPTVSSLVTSEIVVTITYDVTSDGGFGITKTLGFHCHRIGSPFVDDIFTFISMYENCFMLIKISLNFLLKGPFNNKMTLARIITWRRTGDQPLFEPMLS